MTNRANAIMPMVFDTAMFTPYVLLAKCQASERPAMLITEPKKPMRRYRIEGLAGAIAAQPVSEDSIKAPVVGRITALTLTHSFCLHIRIVHKRRR
jgi:hypothetical protein